MNAADRMTQLRALLLERSVVSERDLERHEAELRRAPKGTTLWVLLRAAGALTQKQVETLDLAHKGYVPIDAARVALGSTPSPSASVSGVAAPKLGGLKIARRPGASSTQSPKVTIGETPVPATAEPTPTPATAHVAATASTAPPATGHTEAATPSPRRPSDGPSREPSSMRFQEYAKVALPLVEPTAESAVPSPPQPPTPSRRRKTGEGLEPGALPPPPTPSRRRRTEPKVTPFGAPEAHSPASQSTLKPEEALKDEDDSSGSGKSSNPAVRSATQVDAAKAAALSREASSALPSPPGPGAATRTGESRVAALMREKTPARTMGTLVGRRLGKYQVNSQIGRGASGSVFLAHHVVLNMPVAVKVLDPALASYHPELLKRFMMEARSAARLAHPNIIRVLDCDQIDGFHIIVMEYVDGISVSELIKINGMVAEERALVIVQSVAEGLEAALESGIIHRDIKPANIMVTKNKQVKLADLGLAKRVDEPAEMSETRPNIGLGTPHFFAPEQAADASTADHRSDIYSLGATLYNMLTGQVPFKGKSLPDLVRKHSEEPVVPPIQVVPTVSRLTSELVVHMMAKRPDDRPRNYADLLTGIQACIINLKNRTSGDSASRTNSFVRELFGGLFNKKP